MGKACLGLALGRFICYNLYIAEQDSAPLFLEHKPQAAFRRDDCLLEALLVKLVFKIGDHSIEMEDKVYDYAQCDWIYRGENADRSGTTGSFGISESRSGFSRLFRLNSP